MATINRVPLHLALHDDGSVTYEVAIVGAGDGLDERGRPVPLPDVAYVTVATVPPGIAQQIMDRLADAQGD